MGINDFKFTNAEESLFVALDAIRKQFDLTHAGTLEGHSGLDPVVIYGIPRGTNHLAILSSDRRRMIVVNKEHFEKHTPYRPPFPWNDAGDGLVFPPEGTKQWWEE